MHTTTAPPQQLRARSVAYALLARILGPEPTALTDETSIDALRAALEVADDAAIARLVDIEPHALPEPAQLAGRWVRWFDLGRVAPYEGSNVPTTVGGITPRLADIAGFYRAFGMAVAGDRPDHVVAQLEFLAVTLLAEAEATEDGDPERADIAARATRSFLRDHIGAWIDAWAARVEAIDELGPWFPYAATAADLVRSEAANRNVIPLRESAALQADAGVASAEDAIITCDEVDSDEHSDK
jgi:TorA maturation chaperone TorD